MARDWVRDLGEFDPAIVEEACTRWRRTEARRPTPADIRRLCLDEAADCAPVHAAPLDRPGWDAYARSVGFESAAERSLALDAERQRQRARDREMAAAARERADVWARSRDFADFDAYLAAGGTCADAIKSMLMGG
jgi:hypothetical protein